MGGGAGRGDPFSRMAERPVGKALLPDDKAQEGLASRAGVVTGTSGFSTVALGIVKREAFFEVTVRRSEVPRIQMDQAQKVADLTESMWVSEAYGESQSFPGERQPSAQFSADCLDMCHPGTREECLNLRRRICSNPPSKLDRSPRGPFRRRRGIPLGRRKRPHKSGLEEQLLFIALAAFGKPRDDLDASLQMCDGFEYAKRSVALSPARSQ